MINCYTTLLLCLCLTERARALCPHVWHSAAILYLSSSYLLSTSSEAAHQILVTLWWHLRGRRLETHGGRKTSRSSKLTSFSNKSIEILLFRKSWRLAVWFCSLLHRVCLILFSKSTPRAKSTEGNYKTLTYFNSGQQFHISK